MHKLALPERPKWRDDAAEMGFTFADMHGEPYWDETSAYQFRLQQIEEDLEDPSTALHGMCLEAVARIVESEELLDRLGIPAAYHDLVADSWRRQDPSLYGRFDLAYDGTGPAKLLEYNADTPTSLYESASFQWAWLEGQQAAGVLGTEDDQFNGIHEALVERFRAVFEPGTDLHFTAIGGAPEDYATVECIGWAARHADLGAHYTDLENIGISEDGQFVDDEDRVIGTLFKLYPWENLLTEDYAQYVAGSGCQMVEPAWKAVLSNKGVLPILWEMFEGHPNLLPAFFADDVAEALRGTGAASDRIAAAFTRAAPTLQQGYVQKPLFSREGAGVRIVADGAELAASAPGPYAHHPQIIQAYAPLPVFDGFRPVIGTWIVGDTCVGMGIREDRAHITQDLSRFKPHFIRD